MPTSMMVRGGVYVFEGDSDNDDADETEEEKETMPKVITTSTTTTSTPTLTMRACAGLQDHSLAGHKLKHSSLKPGRWQHPPHSYVPIGGQVHLVLNILELS